MKKDHLFELAESYISQTGISVFLTGRAGTGKTTFLNSSMPLWPQLLHGDGDVTSQGTKHQVEPKRNISRCEFALILVLERG